MKKAVDFPKEILYAISTMNITNSNCVACAPDSKLKPLPAVVKKAIEYNLGKFYRPVSPRRLLLGAFVLFRKEQLKNKELQSRNNWLEKQLSAQYEEVSRLKDYEKQVIYDGYVGELIEYSWTCGDGCCCDSWYGYRIVNPQGVCEKEHGGNRKSTYMSRERAKEEIQDIIGSKASIYESKVDV